MHDWLYMSFFNESVVIACRVQTGDFTWATAVQEEVQTNEVQLLQGMWKKESWNSPTQHISLPYGKVVVSRESIDSNYVCHSWERHRALFAVFGGKFIAMTAGQTKSIYYWLETFNVYYVKYYPWFLTVVWWNKIRKMWVFPGIPAFWSSHVRSFRMRRLTCNSFDTHLSFD